jgi:protein O-mannosyl-transferase
VHRTADHAIHVGLAHVTCGFTDALTRPSALNRAMTRRQRPRPSRRQSPPGPRHNLRPVLALIILAILAYANALANGFVLDDIPIIVENPLVRSVGNIGSIFSSNYWNRGGAGIAFDPTLYRPLTVVTYAIDFTLWGGNPTAFHATNVVLHAATTVLVSLVAVELLGSSAAALLAAAIFAVHPIHVEAVTGIVGRAEVLATLFFLAAFSTLRRRRAFHTGATAGAGGTTLPRSIARAAGGASLYLLGLFSKETAITLPALLALDDWLRRDELPSARRSAATMLALRYGALALAVIVYFAFRDAAVSGNGQIWPGFAGVSAGDRILTASRVLMEYLGLFLFPRTLLADYWKTEVPIATSLAEPLVLVSFLLWIGLAVTVFRMRHRNPALVLSLAWFFITIGPVSNVLFPIGVAKAERLLYLPSVGLCIFAGWGYARAQGLIRGPWALRVAVAAVVVALTARTLVRNRDWRDNLTLAMATLEASPSSPLMNDLAAGALVRRGEPSRAIELLRTAVAQAPDMPLLRSHLGAAYYSQGRVDEAIATYEEAIRRNPSDAEAHNNLGVAYLDKQRVEDAIVEFNAAIRVNPRYADPHMNLGLVHFERGRWVEAAASFSAAIQVNPSSAEAQNSLGATYARMGERERAAERYREALRLKPDFAAARDNLTRLGHVP